MVKNKTLRSFIAGILMVGGSSAMAANLPTTFDFTGKGGQNDSSSITFTSTGGLTTTAVATAPGENVGASSLEGIGVKTGFFNLNSLQNNEVLRVDFADDVNITSFTMRQWEGPDEIIFKAFGDSNNYTLNYGPDSCALCTTETVGVDFKDINYITIEGNSSLTVTYLAGMGVTVVPLPAAAYLFGSALMGLVAISRRRKAIA